MKVMEKGTETKTHFSGFGPGNMLHQARADLRLPVEDVARMLNLSPRHIIALENDDYESLPGPTYVRGYLRSYAQLLGLSPETVIQSYNGLPAASNAPDLTKLAPAAQMSSNDRVIKLGTFLVVGVVIGLTAVWWYGQREMPGRGTSSTAGISPVAPASVREPVASGTPDQTEPPHPVEDEMAAVPDLEDRETAPPPAETAMDEGKSGSAESLQTVTSAGPSKPSIAEGKLGPASASDDGGPLAPGAGVRAKASNVDSTEGSAGATAAAAPRIVKSPDTGPGVARGRLVLHTREDSWVDIRDGRQNRLLYETIPAGRTVLVEGVLPFSVFLGNVDGVSVEFNGQRYDATRYRRGPVARFVLSGPAETQN